MRKLLASTNQKALSALALAIALGASACAHPPRPAVMADAEHARGTPAAAEASQRAPQAFSHAENLRTLAEEAYEKRDYVGAQLLSERAIAAYQHAHVLARLARAASVTEEASVDLRQAEEKLAHTEEELARVLADVNALELRIRVARDALPITPSSPTTDYKRELARLASSRSLALDARLLCTAAKLLDARAPGLDEAEGLVFAVAEKLARERPHPAPIDEASRARARCLGVLTAARRAAEAASSMGHADALLSALSAIGGLEPMRDDRGIVVTLHNVFQGRALSREADGRLRELGRIATAHPSFPIQVVVHSAKGARPSELAQQEARGAEVAKVLLAAGVASREKIHVESAGSAKPVIDPSSTRDRHRNERVEVVFVNPGG